MSDAPACTPEQLRWWRAGYDTAKIGLGARIEGLELLLSKGGPCLECQVLGREVDRLAKAVDVARLQDIDQANELHEVEGRLKTARAELERERGRRVATEVALRLAEKEQDAGLQRQAAAAAELQRLRNRIAELEAQAD